MVLEILGYVASVLVAVSLMMTSVVRLRLVNLVGSLAFTVYGVLIGALPVALVNFVIVIVNAVFLVRLLSRSTPSFEVMEVRPDSALLARFLRWFDEDIRRFVPTFRYRPAEDQLRLLVMHGLEPVGLFIGRPESDDVMRVDVDYAVPGYRDLAMGRFLFGPEAADLRRRGVRHVVTDPGAEEHRVYLERMGFRPAAGSMVLDLGDPSP